MTHIYHITTFEKWRQAVAEGEYRPNSLADEGFIHCSYADQLLDVAKRFYQGEEELIVLGIERSQVDDAVVDELPADGTDGLAGEQFPHLYGPLPVAAVRNVAMLTPNEDNRFVWPPELPRPAE